MRVMSQKGMKVRSLSLSRRWESCYSKIWLSNFKGMRVMSHLKCVMSRKDENEGDESHVTQRCDSQFQGDEWHDSHPFEVMSRKDENEGNKSHVFECFKGRRAMSHLKCVMSRRKTNQGDESTAIALCATVFCTNDLWCKYLGHV